VNAIDKTEERIRSAICSIPNQLPRNGIGDRVWTKAVFKSLADLGVTLKYQICSSSSDGEFDGGWLYDLIWYENDTNGQLKSVPLILESEWHKAYDRIKYDFEKLLVGRARYKVIIFQASGKRMLEYFKMMKSGIKAFRGPHFDERYLLVCFDETRWVFEIRTIKVEKSA
jgi:hypothetical protein